MIDYCSLLTSRSHEVVSALVLMTVAVVACMVPAARAARVDVMQALRSE